MQPWPQLQDAQPPASSESDINYDVPKQVESLAIPKSTNMLTEANQALTIQ